MANNHSLAHTWQTILMPPNRRTCYCLQSRKNVCDQRDCNDPAVSDIVYTDTGNGKVVYSRKVGTKTLLYVNEVQGAFADTGDLSTGVGLSCRFLLYSISKPIGIQQRLVGYKCTF